MKINTLIIDVDQNWKKTISKFVQMNPILELSSEIGIGTTFSILWSKSNSGSV